VADGAARQAAWVLAGGSTPPEWGRARVQTYDGDVVPAIRDRYAEVRDLTAARQRSVTDVSPVTPGASR
jgi:xylulokinase